VRPIAQLDVVSMAEGLWPSFLGSYPEQELLCLQAACAEEVSVFSVLNCGWFEEAERTCWHAKQRLAEAPSWPCVVTVNSNMHGSMHHLSQMPVCSVCRWPPVTPQTLTWTCACMVVSPALLLMDVHIHTPCFCAQTFGYARVCRLPPGTPQSLTWMCAYSSCHGTRRPSLAPSNSVHLPRQPATAGPCSTTCCRLLLRLRWRRLLCQHRQQQGARRGALLVLRQGIRLHILWHTLGACWSSWQGGIAVK
jgi:hypothetical protein